MVSFQTPSQTAHEEFLSMVKAALKSSESKRGNEEDNINIKEMSFVVSNGSLVIVKLVYYITFCSTV